MATGTCMGGVCSPERTQGLKAKPKKGTYVLVDLKGPGLFLAAEVVKQGGINGATFVDLTIDGKNVTNISFAGARNCALTQANPFGLVYLQGKTLKTLTIGWPAPLAFRRGLRLSVIVEETGVVQVLGNVIHGKF